MSKNSIRNTIGSIFLYSSILGACGLYMAHKTQNAQKRINIMQTEMLEKDSFRYENTKNKAKSYAGTTLDLWAREYKLMKDSLALDSMIKKAYFDGAQMVRDSIKKAK